MSRKQEISFTTAFLQDLTYWISTDRRISLKILELVDSIHRDPFFGIGKPEPLRHLSGNTWSRRITQEHRIVYRVTADKIIFAQARYHY
ncbi:MAG: Txe/YoeB family addiction module toxin [Chthoniobacterales bacterium]